MLEVDVIGPAMHRFQNVQMLGVKTELIQEPVDVYIYFKIGTGNNGTGVGARRAL